MICSGNQRRTVARA